MEQTKRKWGDRKDGIWLKDIPAMNRIMPALLPNRADNEAINYNLKFFDTMKFYQLSHSEIVGMIAKNPFF